MWPVWRLSQGIGDEDFRECSPRIQETFVIASVIKKFPLVQNDMNFPSVPCITGDLHKLVFCASSEWFLWGDKSIELLLATEDSADWEDDTELTLRESDLLHFRAPSPALVAVN